MYCCKNCFSDSFLKRHIAAISSRTGKCDFCKSSNVSLLNPTELFDHFEPLIELYEEDTSGQSLLDLIQSDWNVFGFSGLRLQQKLLRELTQAESSVKSKYKARFLQDKKNIEQWDGFREELMHRKCLNK